MNILLGTNHLEKTGGTENYLLAMAQSLLNKGHSVEYFCFKKGSISSLLEEMGIPFMSKKYYDLIISNHKNVVSYLCWKGFTIQTCHGKIPPIEQPSPKADLHVGISEEIKKHVMSLGYDCYTILNGIDCSRFYPQKPINTELKVVLSLCQGDEAHQFVKECCDQLNIRFIRADKAKDNVFNIENTINEADLVVGIGRSIYDSMACGRCVISYDYRVYNNKPLGDGYISKEKIENSIKDNFIGRNSGLNFTHSLFIEELKKYKKEDGGHLREFAEKELNIDLQVQKYIQLYEKKQTEINTQSIISKLLYKTKKQYYHFYEWQKQLFSKKK
jgi:glycosyltransferase involved in cell wall biosynthesis